MWIQTNVIKKTNSNNSNKNTNKQTNKQTKPQNTEIMQLGFSPLSIQWTR